MSCAPQCPDKQPLLLRRDPSKYGILLCRRPQSVLRFQCRSVHIVLCTRDACLRGNLRNGQGVIPGDDLDGNALLRKVTESLRRIPADGIGQQNQSHGNHGFRQRLSVWYSFVSAEQNRPKAIRTVAFHQGTVLLIITPQDKLRRAEDIGIIRENSSAILVCRGEWKHGFGILFERCFEVTLQRLHGQISLGHCSNQRADLRFQANTLGWIKALHENDAADLHLIFRDSSGFVHAQHINSGKGFDALHIVNQYLLGCQTDHADHQRNACQQIQPLRDHSNYGSYHGENTALEGCAGEHILLHKQENTNRDNQNTHNAHHSVQHPEHLGVLLLILSLGFQR